MKVKIDSKLYDPPTEDDQLSMGELRLLKREYGFVPGRDGVDLRDQDHLCAFLFMTMRKAMPQAPANMLVSQIDDVRQVDFVGDDGSPLSEEEAAAQADPTPAPTGAAPSSGSEPAPASS